MTRHETIDKQLFRTAYRLARDAGLDTNSSDAAARRIVEHAQRHGQSSVDRAVADRIIQEHAAP